MQLARIGSQRGKIPYKWIVVMVVVFGSFMSILDQTVVNNALPHTNEPIKPPCGWSKASEQKSGTKEPLLGGRSTGNIEPSRLLFAPIAPISSSTPRKSAKAFPAHEESFDSVWNVRARPGDRGSSLCLSSAPVYLQSLKAYMMLMHRLSSQGVRAREAPKPSSRRGISVVEALV